MPENLFYKLTRKMGRNWDAETRHLIHPPSTSSQCITFTEPPKSGDQDRPHFPRRPAHIFGRSPTHRPLADAVDWAAIRSDMDRFGDWFQEAAKDLSPGWQSTKYNDLPHSTEPLDGLRPAPRTPNATRKPEKSMSAGKKVEGWLENVYGDGRHRPR